MKDLGLDWTMRISCFQGVDHRGKGEMRVEGEMKGKSRNLLAFDHGPLSLFYALQRSWARTLMTGNAPPHNS